MHSAAYPAVTTVCKSVPTQTWFSKAFVIVSKGKRLIEWNFFFKLTTNLIIFILILYFRNKQIFWCIVSILNSDVFDLVSINNNLQCILSQYLLLMMWVGRRQRPPLCHYKGCLEKTIFLCHNNRSWLGTLFSQFL